MIETAQVLGQCSKLKAKCIVITGAMRPERFSNSDAKFNLGAAVGIMSVVNSGVYVSMNGIARSWDKVKRCQKTGQFISK